MKYHIRGKGSITLSRNDFIARGGEGEIFGKKDTIYKIYLDATRMIPDAKIGELSVLDRFNILRPKEVILNGRDTPVGFTMDWIRETVPLCRFFTSDFRHQRGIDDGKTLALVENIKETILAIHRAGCLMVDGNEFNYLVDRNNLVTPYFIDVDSYQTPSYPATAIMPSIRDRHSRAFSELTDWFAFAVVACQLFVGIHPFKGRHPDFKKNDIESRMKANVSIFNGEVKRPPAARDLQSIPSHYRTWFHDLFEKGKRSLPPSAPGAMVAVPGGHLGTVSSEQFDIQQIAVFAEPVQWHDFQLGKRLIRTDTAIHVAGRAYPAGPYTAVILTPKRVAPVFAGIIDGVLALNAPDDPLLPFPAIEAETLLVAENTLFVRHGGRLTELAFDDTGKRILPSVRTVWNIMPHSSQVFDRVIYQNVLGKPFLVMPRPGMCTIRAIPELEDYRIVDGRRDGGVCVLTGHNGQRYDRITIRFDKKYDGYDCRVTEDIDPVSINFVTLDKGIVVLKTGDGTIEIFSVQPGRSDVRVVNAPDGTGDARLCREGNTVMFFRGKSLYRMRMGSR